MRSGFLWAYAVKIPSINNLYKITPMPWATGSSWLRELEGRGIPNLGRYMYVDRKAVDPPKEYKGAVNQVED